MQSRGHAALHRELNRALRHRFDAYRFGGYDRAVPKVMSAIPLLIPGEFEFFHV